MTSLILFITTFSDEEQAAAVIRQLLEERLIACGTMMPKAKSIYSWQGTIEENNEVVVFIKTTLSLQAVCMKRLQELHPYEVPEILGFSPNIANESYAAWIKNFTCNL